MASIVILTIAYIVAVTFSAAPRTLEEKHLVLTPNINGYYDEIARFAAAKEESKNTKNARYRKIPFFDMYPQY